MAINKKLRLMSLLALLSMLLYLLITDDIGNLTLLIAFRWSKAYAIVLSAVCIGISTIIFQTMVNNNIISPGLMGINAIYVLIFTLVVFVLGSDSILITNKNISFIMVLLVMSGVSLALYYFLFKKTGGNILVILLTGTVLTTLLRSITSTLQRLIDPNEFQSLQSRLYATFNKSNDEILLLATLSIIGLLFISRAELKKLDVIALGRNNAINLGIDYDTSVRKLMLVVTLLVSIATAVVGPITFLGLIIANLSRQFFKTYKHKVLILGSVLAGCILLFLGQTYIEHVLNYTANISVFVNITGGLYFLVLILRNGR